MKVVVFFFLFSPQWWGFALRIEYTLKKKVEVGRTHIKNERRQMD